MRQPSAVVGRDDEQLVLQRCLNAAIQGEGCLVLISGELGIGKTTLLNCMTVEAQAYGMLILTGAGCDFSLATPYDPWTELRETYPLDNDLPELRDWLCFNTSRASPDQLRLPPHETHQFLAAVVERIPILLILDDLHRADRARLELLRYLTRGLHHLPLVIAASYCEDELSPDVPLYHVLPHLVKEGPTERLQLGPFDQVTIRQMIASYYGLDPNDEDRLTRYLHQHAEGNPFFTHELLRELNQEKVIDKRNDHWQVGVLIDVPVPPLIQQVIDGRLRQLGTEEREFLSVAAVIGQEIPIEIWQQASEASDEQLEKATEAALAVNLLSERMDGVLVFSNALVREAIESRITLPKRLKLHKQVAEALLAEPDGQQDFEHIAYHLRRAHDPRAALWLVRAGKRAFEQDDCETAIERLSAAMELISDAAQSLKMQAMHVRGMAYEITGAWDRALADYQAMLTLAKQGAHHRETWQAMILLGNLWAARDYREAREYFMQALDIARESDDREMLGHSLNRIGNWYTSNDLTREGLKYHREALEIFQELSQETGIAETSGLLAFATYLDGDFSRSAEYYRRAVRLFREQGCRKGLASCLPTLLITGGSYDSDTVQVASDSEEVWSTLGEEGLAAAHEIGWRAREARSLILMASSTAIRGNYQEALNASYEGLKRASEIDHREWVAAGNWAIGAILLDILATPSAIDHLEHAYDTARAIHSRHWTRKAASFLASAHLADGRYDAVEHILTRTLNRESNVDIVGLRQCWFRCAEFELARDNAEVALEISERLVSSIPGAGQWHFVPHLAWLKGRALTALEEFEEARTVLNLAHDRARDLRYTPLLWRIELEQGRLYHHMSDAEASARAFDEGRRHITELSLGIDSIELRAEFLDRALSTFPGDWQVENSVVRWSGLSMREREVLKLVTQGMTDTDVAKRLSISPRTVGRHLQSIYNKLGVNSRTAATAIALEHDLL